MLRCTSLKPPPSTPNLLASFWLFWSHEHFVTRMENGFCPRSDSSSVVSGSYHPAQGFSKFLCWNHLSSHACRKEGARAASGTPGEVPWVMAEGLSLYSAGLEKNNLGERLQMASWWDRASSQTSPSHIAVRPVRKEP